MRFSVLVVGYNSRCFLEDCFSSLLATAHGGFEILFLDNDSPEKEADWLENRYRDTRMRIFRSKHNLYFAGGVNFLSRHARGEFLVLLNPDTRVEPDWLAVLDRGLVEGGYDAAQADLRTLEDGDRRETEGYFLDCLGFIVHAPPSDGHPRPIFGGRGAGLVIRRAVYSEAGALDEDFKMYFEETDLCWRINLLGYRIAYIPGAILYHARGGSSRPGFFRWNHFRFLRNRVLSLVKNYQAASLARYLPLHMLMLAASAVANLARLKPGMALTEGAALLAPWFLLGSALRKRAVVQAMRRISDGELMERGLILAQSKYFGAHRKRDG